MLRVIVVWELAEVAIWGFMQRCRFATDVDWLSTLGPLCVEREIARCREVADGLFVVVGVARAIGIRGPLVELVASVGEFVGGECLVCVIIGE